MTEALKKPDWIPYYIQRIKGSSAWQLQDFQFCWYWKLLTEAADSDIPGYLVNDVRTLWRLAGARTEKFFRERGGMELVARYFSRTDDGLHIYNEKLLAVLHEQMTKLTKRRRRSISSLSLCIQELPDWVPVEAFGEYKEMREKIKKPLTGNATKLAVSKLEKLKEQGHDPKAVLEQSIFRSWAGLFPIEQVTNGRGQYPGTNASGQNGITPKAKSLSEKDCPICKGEPWIKAPSGGVTRCECYKRNQRLSHNGAANGCGAERPMPNVAGAGRDFKAAGANDR